MTSVTTPHRERCDHDEWSVWSAEGDPIIASFDYRICIACGRTEHRLRDKQKSGIGIRRRDERRARGLTIAIIAHRMNVAPSLVSRLESGRVAWTARLHTMYIAALHAGGDSPWESAAKQERNDREQIDVVP